MPSMMAVGGMMHSILPACHHVRIWILYLNIWSQDGPNSNTYGPFENLFEVNQVSFLVIPIVCYSLWRV